MPSSVIGIELPPASMPIALGHKLRRSLTLLVLALAALFLPRAGAASFDVVVYGATPGGITTAIAAARDGRSVLLVEPTHRIGGMATCGLMHTDFRTLESLTGLFLEYTRRVEAHYVRQSGPDSVEVKLSFRGTQAEPKVALQVFEEMLGEHPRIRVQRRWTLREARMRGPAGDRQVRALRFLDPDGAAHEIEGGVFVDGTYEGDLIATAQVPYRIGSESRDEFGESLAPADGSRAELQAYNFRLIVTQDPANRVAPRPPPGYRRELFTGLLPFLREGKIRRLFAPGHASDAVMIAHAPGLPRGKFDANDLGASYVRMSLPGLQLPWPEGDAVTRERIFHEHLVWNVGIMYFLQNDLEVPAALRAEAQTWGFCRDEFTDSDHLPPQLYVREARRMLGRRIFTQHDTRHAPNDARAVLHRDSIAIGDYGHNSHGNRHEGPRFGGKRHGTNYGALYPVPAHQVPYGTIVPEDVRNLLAPVPVSATHVGFCALRYEPIWAALGEAAGHAAHLALQAGAGADVRRISVGKLQQRLHAVGAATLYVSDVPPGHPDFAAVQWWGTLGGFHGLAARPPGNSFRDLLGPLIGGQYFEAWKHHAAELDRPLDPPLEAKWRALAAELRLTPPAGRTAGTAMTRRDWIRAVHSNPAAAP